MRTREARVRDIDEAFRGRWSRVFVASLALMACGSPRSAAAPASAPAAPQAAHPQAPADRCAAGDGQACYAAGVALRKDPKAGLSGAEEATRLFARGCDAGVQDACAEAGRSLAWGMGSLPDAPRGAAALDSACTAGSKVGCALFGELLRQGVGVPRDLARAERLLRTACDGGDGEACNETALILDDRSPKPEPEIRALLRKACDQGFAYGCRNLAIRDTTLSHGASLALLERACAGDAPTACSDLGVQLQEGKGVPRDPAEAGRKFVRACDGGDATGCYWLGRLVRAGNGVPRDPARAAVLFARACDSHSQPSCASLASMLELGEGTDANPAHARELEEGACKARVGEACGALSFARPKAGADDQADRRARLDRLCGEGQVVEACVAIARWSAFHPLPDAADETRATTALARACALGGADGCVLAHDARVQAKLPADPKLLSRACELDAADGCAREAEALSDGSLGHKDPEAARKVASRSCDAQSARGCAALADALDRDHASPQDLARAADLRDKACKGGWSKSCRALAKMARNGRGVARDPQRAQALDAQAAGIDDD